MKTSDFHTLSLAVGKANLSPGCATLKIIAGTAALLCASLQFAQAQVAPPQALLDAAKKEGQVTWYETSVPEVGAKLKEAFDKRFDGIKLTHVSVSNAEQMSPRLLQEMRANAPSADVVQISPDQILTLEKRGALADVDWSQVGLSKEQAQKPFAVATSVTTFVLMANTKLVTEAERPKTWDDLLAPKWKGKISMWGNPFPFVQLASTWGDEKTRAYLTKFSAQEPTLFPAPTSVVQAVVSGDLPIGVGLYHVATNSVKAGAPLALKPLDIAPISVNYSAVLKATKNPNAARLLIWWLSTDDGAKAYEAATNRGNLFVPSTDAAKMLKTVNTAAWSLDKSDSFQTLAPAYQTMLRSQK
jgi:iron(III) transport system substrate-binding protein